jgi:cobalamin biosynthesis protein CobD/CbiB
MLLAAVLSTAAEPYEQVPWPMIVEFLSTALVLLIAFQARQMAAAVKDIQNTNQAQQVEIARLAERLKWLERTALKDE